MDFVANLQPVQVPTLASATADNLARFQAQFTTNIVSSGNSLLAGYIALKDTNFYAVGDIPTLGLQTFAIDPYVYATAKTHPTTTAPVTDWEALEGKLDELASLATPVAPTLAAIDANVPSLTAAPPVIVIPSAPSADVGVAPSTAPNLEAAATPEAPTVTLPDAPTFDELHLPEPPAFDVPTWTAVAPQNLLAPPTSAFSYVDPGYVSSLHDPLVQKLLADLSEGSYGIEPAVEAQLWGRARDRAAQVARTGVEEALRRAAATSFPVPQGHLQATIEVAEQKGVEIVTEANRDIATKRADMYVDGRKFTIQQVQGYETIRINLYNATQERALNYAKAVVETGVAIYDAGVRNYNAQLEGYKTEAQVFETRVRALLVKAEIFKAQVEVEKTRVDFNRAKVEMYLGQLKGVETVVDLYKSRLAAASLFMQLQAQKLDVFRTQVQTYAERVRAKEAEFGIYKAQIAGQLANVDVFKAQIDAYNAQLSGIDTRAKVQLQSNEALLQNYRTATQVYASNLDAFTKQITTRLDEAKTKSVIYGADIDAYRAYVNAALESGRLQVNQNQQVLDWNRTSLASRVAQVEFRLKQLGLSVDLQKDVNSHGMDFMRTALGGAVSGLNSLGVKSE